MSAPCSNAASTSTSTGCCSAPCCCSPASASAMIYSATYVRDPAGRAAPAQFWTQLYALAIGLVGAARLPDDRLPACSRSTRSLLYRGLSRRCSSSCSSSAPRRSARSAGSRSARSTVQPSEFARIDPGAGPGDLLRREPPRRANNGDLAHRRRASSPSPFLLIAKQPDLGHGGDAAAGLPRHRVSRRAAAAPAGGARDRRRPARAPVAWTLRAQGLPEVAHRDVPRSRNRTRAAPATSRFRPGSPSGRAASRARGSGRARRGGTSSCPSPTTTSSSRCSPRSTGSSACWSRSGSICS